MHFVLSSLLVATLLFALIVVLLLGLILWNEQFRGTFPNSATNVIGRVTASARFAAIVLGSCWLVVLLALVIGGDTNAR